MKKKISRILGVVLTLVLLSSLAVTTAVPVSAGTQEWSTFSTPSATGLVLDPGNTWTGPFAIDKDGTAIYASSDVGGLGAALVKSTDGGRTWAALTGFTATIAGTPGTFTDIVCSSIYANTVYVTDGADIWKTSDGGTTWAPLSSLFTSLPISPGLTNSGYIVSLDVGYLGTAPYIFAALSAFGFGAVGGGAYVCEEAVWGMPWTDLLIGTDRAAPWTARTDVSEIVVDPVNFGTTQMVMAVADTGGGSAIYRLGDLGGSTSSTWAPAPPAPPIGNYSALLTHGGAAPGSVYVEFTPAPGTTLTSLQTDIAGATGGFSFQHFTPATLANWAQFELRFEDPASTGWLEITAVGLQNHTGSGAWATETLVAATLAGYGGNTPNGGSVFDWTLANNLTNVQTDVAALFNAVQAGSGAQTANYVLTRVRVELWEASPARSCYIDDVTIAGGSHDLEPLRTSVTTKYGGAQWDAIVNDVGLPGVGSALYSASIWLPDDFNSNLASGLMKAFVGVDPITVAEGDAFLAVFGVPAGTATAAFDLNLSGAAIATHVSGLDGVGSAAGASLLASGSTSAATTVPRVFRSTIGGFTWLADTKAPTGGATPFGISRALPSILVLDSTTALVGTHGADCGVSITNDYGATWNGISLLNATITSIDDLELGSLFMATSGAHDAVWRHDGTNWERVFSGSIYAPATTSFLVQQSPAGDAVFVADLGGTTIWRSMDDGQTWMAQVSAVAVINSLLVVDANSMFVGGNAVIYSTTTNGGFWFTMPATGGGAIQSLDMAADGTLVAGSANLRVFISTNGGLTWTPTATAPPITAPVVVAFDASDSNIIYATGATGGVVRWDRSATSPAWARIDNRLGQPPSVTTTTTTTTTIGADAFSVTFGAIGDDFDLVETSGAALVTVLAGAPTVAYNAATWTWTVTATGAADAVLVTAIGTATPCSGTITDVVGVANAAVLTLVVTSDANSNAVVPATIAIGGTGSFVLPDVVSTTSTTTTTTTVTPYNVNVGTGLVSASDGALYATDSSAVAAGVSRSINPTVKAAKVFFDQVPCGSTVTLTGLWLTAGSNVLWSIGTGGTVSPTIYTYTDTLVRDVTGTSSTVTTNSAALSWSDVPNADAYRVYVSTSSAAKTYSTAATATDAGITVVVDDAANTATVTGLQPAVKYYWSVWVSAPVISFGAGTQSFTTLPRVPVNLVPPNGAQDMPLLPSFGWDAVPGAVSYDFELGTAPDFSGATQVSTTTIFLTWETELPYDTNHYWRVRAIGVAGPSAWCESNFHTMVEAIPPVTVEPAPTPTIILPTPTVTVIPPDIIVEPPDITVDITQPTPTTTIVQPVIEMPEEVTPAYIWAIVAIGALLVIAVIMLIIRTRRVV